MTKPYLRLSTLTAGLDPVDLTALSGGLVNSYTIRGFDGSDWMATDGNGNAFRHKWAGASQLVPTFFNDTGSACSIGGYTTFQNPAHWDYSDMVGGDAPSSDYQPNTAFGINVPQANSGIKFRLMAHQDFRHAEFVTEAYSGFIVKATSSDGSSVAATLPLATDGLKRFALDWCTTAPAPDAYVDLEVRCTNTAGGYLRPLYAWIGRPIVPLPSRGFLLRSLRSFGGPNR